MAQRGGFVKAQLRIGRASAGPGIPEKGADLVIATEVSETLKAVRYVKPGGDVVLFGYVWAPTAVVLGKAPYPALDQVAGQVSAAGGAAASRRPLKPAAVRKRASARQHLHAGRRRRAARAWARSCRQRR